MNKRLITMYTPEERRRSFSESLLATVFLLGSLSFLWIGAIGCLNSLQEWQTKTKQESVNLSELILLLFFLLIGLEGARSAVGNLRSSQKLFSPWFFALFCTFICYVIIWAKQYSILGSLIGLILIVKRLRKKPTYCMRK